MVRVKSYRETCCTDTHAFMLARKKVVTGSWQGKAKEKGKRVENSSKRKEKGRKVKQQAKGGKGQ